MRQELNLGLITRAGRGEKSVVVTPAREPGKTRQKAQLGGLARVTTHRYGNSQIGSLPASCPESSATPASANPSRSPGR